ncbi:Oligosaccharyl transferase STT3 subunit-domain-containing protein [Dimargaris cristalligena]|uniref:dolichyl-diphosphooligosaccharide--protein glycotransferase n=1 Tax=Dimargaris cristalligena TaxID=215637 RepID=A0A4P9ZU35_9FUNG|nr:Oligosaccharyl transferase STT3 subunit-domain-containing protein [Dimargaris cristalligena]|eukprot:RKP37106.1 Oligosaccharyl transferase STT3 subunit-domain-containing protein [Dimargaris cristalligena]
MAKPSSVAVAAATPPTPATRDMLPLLRVGILVLIAIIGFSSRLFSVVRFESIIHEFDPWFNYRSTQYMVKNGMYSFWNWFDERSWYPLGRVVGGTVYPGLMVTATVIHNILHGLNYPMDIRNICVMMAPLFSGLTALATYLFTSEVCNRTAGLFAAVFIAVAPGYISRSVAGSYDYEGIAIFILMLCFYLWLRALRTGSPLMAVFTAVTYFYMVATWGGYVFIINLIPLHAFVLILMGRFSNRLYVAYCTFYAVGTMAAMQIPFVGFQPTSSSEHMAALGTFGMLQLVAFAHFVRSHLPNQQFKQLLRWLLVGGVALLVGIFLLLSATRFIAPWTGRFYSLWDTGYAKANIPIIASVSEHQPTAWASLFFDLQLLMLLFPAGIYFCFTKFEEAQIFVIIYSLFASYFAGVMVRLVLTLTPIVCVAAGIAMANLLYSYGSPTATPAKPRNSIIQLAVLGCLFISVLMFMFHSTWATSEAYSSPSVVLASSRPDGSRIIIDDFRDAYYWLRKNTAPDAKLMSWWDYGYQLTGFTNRTVLVDNNTWNNTHIATVGLAMGSDEDKAYEILRKLDVDYVLVVFGGLVGYSGDDLNKFLWMVRIAAGVYPDELNEKDFYTAGGEFRLDDQASQKMKDSLMYKLSYYRFNEALQGQGMDRVRQSKAPSKPIRLDMLEEVMTSSHWIVRIFKLKEPDNLGRNLHKVATFNKKQK